MNYAKIEDEIVTNVIVADAAFIATQTGTWVLDSIGVGIGWSYNGTAFIAPIPEPAPPPPRITILSKLEYMNRFTDAELAAIYTAAKTSVQIEVWLEKFKLSGQINLEDDRTINGVNVLEYELLIETGRAAEILS